MTAKGASMPRLPCTACVHPDRARIDEALRSGTPPLRELAKQVGIHHASLFRHKQHVAPVSGKAVKEIPSEIVKLRRMLVKAKQKHDTPAALSISREIRAWMTLDARTRDVKATDAGRVEEISRSDALSLAEAIVEAQLNDPDVVAWLTGMERIQIAPVLPENE
jgi:hypothetical protein